MLWLIIAFLGPLFHGLSNIFDNYLVNKLFKDPFILVFYSSLINLIFLPFIFLISVPSLPSLDLIPFYLLLGLINVLYLYPYYKALQNDDTSVVVSLFSLEKLLVPILAFFIVGEILSFTQYIGFFVVILSGSVLTLNNHNKKFTINKSFFYMTLVSFILAFESVLYKYVFNNVDWSTGFTWSLVASFIVTLPILLIRKNREKIHSQWHSFKSKSHVFVFEELLTFGGSAASTFAISLVPVTVVISISSVQPFFVLIFAV
ncbi:MAG: DMT family transporter, partial [Nanoarchaeota archaeon]